MYVWNVWNSFGRCVCFITPGLNEILPTTIQIFHAFLLMKQIQAIYREETTHKYMISDMELKRKAMEKVGSAGNSSYKYKPSADIMNFLNSLC